jgi:hypothetical protein
MNRELGPGLEKPVFYWCHLTMARTLRLEYPGGVYHVTSQGNMLGRISLPTLPIKRKEGDAGAKQPVHRQSLVIYSQISGNITPKLLFVFNVLKRIAILTPKYLSALPRFWFRKRFRLPSKRKIRQFQ